MLFSLTSCALKETAKIIAATAYCKFTIETHFMIPPMNTFISKLTISLHQASTKAVANAWDVWRRGWPMDWLDDMRPCVSAFY